MKRTMLLILVGGLLLIIRVGASPLSLQPVGELQSRSKADRQCLSLDYAPAPADNPLKGFMPFYDAYGSAFWPIATVFPQSREYFYLALPALINWANKFYCTDGRETPLQSIVIVR